MLYRLAEEMPYPRSVHYERKRVSACGEPKSPKPGTIVYRQQGKGLGSGGTAFVELLPSGQVIKIPKPDPYSPTYAKDARDNMRFEAKIYDKLGEHPRIPKIFGWDESSCSLKMEYMEHGNLREYMRQHREAIPSQVRPKWARQAAEGVRLLHENNVVHCDISPRNFLLDHELDLKICDFGGSSLNGSRPTAYMSTRYCPPNYKWDDTPQPRDDIFSLGSLIYFIMTNEYPYEEVPSEEVETQYNSLQFPDVSEISCGSLILDCWHRRIDAVQVCEELARQSS
ncbi:kinase-like protein [Aspergillus heterothallicus]